MRLSDPLPLRSVASVSGYRADGLLPRIYGDLAGAAMLPRRIGETRYVYADHVAHVRSVWIDGQQTDAWEARVIDLDGRAATIIDLAAPPPVAAVVSASGRGLEQANPADIARDLLRHCRIDIPLSDALDRLRGECDRAQIALAGVLAERMTVRQALQIIMGSAGAAWCSSAAWLHPPPRASSDAPSRLARAGVGQARIALDLMASRIEVHYDEQHGAETRFRQRLRARASPALVDRTLEMRLPWVRSAHVATSIARRMLAYRAGLVYSVSLETHALDDAPIGASLRLAHPAAPSGSAVVVGHARAGGRVRLDLEVRPSDDDAQVMGVEIASAGVQTQYAAIEVESSGGDVSFRVTDESGRPLPGARVALDGGAARITDADGRVRFTGVAPGRHVLTVHASGYAPYQVEVVI